MNMNKIELLELSQNEMEQICGGDKFMNDFGIGCGKVIGSLVNMFVGEANRVTGVGSIAFK